MFLDARILRREKLERSEMRRERHGFFFLFQHVPALYQYKPNFLFSHSATCTHACMHAYTSHRSHRNEAPHTYLDHASRMEDLTFSGTLLATSTKWHLHRMCPTTNSTIGIPHSPYPFASSPRQMMSLSTRGLEMLLGAQMI